MNQKHFQVKHRSILALLNVFAEALMRKNFRKESLTLSNILRRRHNSGDLELDDNLCRMADEWAYELSRRGNLAHDQSISDGENLFYHCSENGEAMKAKDPIHTWYVKVSDV